MNSENTRTHEELAEAIKLARDQLSRFKSTSETFSRLTNQLEAVTDTNSATLRALEQASRELATSNQIAKDTSTALTRFEKLLTDAQTISRQNEQRALNSQQETRTKLTLALLVSGISAISSVSVMVALLRLLHH